MDPPDVGMSAGIRGEQQKIGRTPGRDGAEGVALPEALGGAPVAAAIASISGSPARTSELQLPVEQVAADDRRVRAVSAGQHHAAGAMESPDQREDVVHARRVRSFAVVEAPAAARRRSAHRATRSVAAVGGGGAAADPLRVVHRRVADVVAERCRARSVQDEGGIGAVPPEMRAS